MWDGRSPADGAWATYTPTWTSTGTDPTNYAGTGYFLLAQKTVTFFARVLANSSGFTAGTGQYEVSLPLPGMTLAGTLNAQLVVAEALDASAGAVYAAKGRIASGASLVALYCPPTTAGAFDRGVTPTAPFTFANSDALIVSGTYQID